MTYISAGENSFRTGVGENPLKLNGGEPKSNLKAHILDDEVLLTTLEVLCSASGQASSEGSEAEGQYEGLCRIRRKKIEQELIKWEINLRILADAQGAATATLFPAIRLIAPDWVQALGYPQPIFQRLMRLQQRGMKPVKTKTAKLAIAYTHKGLGKGQAVRISLFVGGKKLGLKLSDPRIADEFVVRFAGVQTHESKGTPRCEIPTHNQADHECAVEILDWISAKLWPDSEADTAA